MDSYRIELSEEDFVIVRVALMFRLEDQKKLAMGYERIKGSINGSITGSEYREACASEAALCRNETKKIKRILDELYRLTPFYPKED